MHVTEFFDALVFGPDVEVVEALLPDVLRRVIEKTSLGRVVLSSGPRENAARKA